MIFELYARGDATAPVATFGHKEPLGNAVSDLADGVYFLRKAGGEDELGVVIVQGPYTQLMLKQRDAA